MAALLQRAGYHTACIGKWHLGWDWAVRAGCDADLDTYNDCTWIDFQKPIGNSPCNFGFDHFYGISGSLDMPPYVYVNDDHVVEEPTAWGTAKEFCRAGPRMPSLRAHNVLQHLTEQAVQHIHSQAQANSPFFLYLPLTAPHSPVSPASEFLGASGVNPYADFCMEVDYRVGQIMETLVAAGIDQDTLVIFTSDNGASASQSECAALEEHFGHFCSERYRGYKSDIWDGGHRVPFLARWPAAIEAGLVCDDPVGLFDFYATVAEMTEQSMPSTAGGDSVSLLPAFREGSIPDAEERLLVHHSVAGMFAARQGAWKVCRCPGSGGWSLPDEQARSAGLPDVQLYNINEDPGEKNNLADQYPERVAHLTSLLDQAVLNGRTTTGPAFASEVTLNLEESQQLNWRHEIPQRYVCDD